MQINIDTAASTDDYTILSNVFSEGGRSLPVVLRLVLQGTKVDVVVA